VTKYNNDLLEAPFFTCHEFAHVFSFPYIPRVFPRPLVSQLRPSSDTSNNCLSLLLLISTQRTRYTIVTLTLIRFLELIVIKNSFLLQTKISYTFREFDDNFDDNFCINIFVNIT